MRLTNWLDERTGYREISRKLFLEPVRGGASFAFVFGSALVFVLLLQAITGVLLASSYAPSSSDAWASVAYIQTQPRFGWLIRGLHATGATALVILCVVHLLQVTIYGAYRRPREINWYVGLLMFGCLLAFALTGYLLPWDQKGYWATQVATSLLGSLPSVGPQLRRLLIGGSEYGNLTLTHFFTLHVLVLPAAMLLLTALHLMLMRRHGVTPTWRRSEASLTARTEPFWPGQLTRDLLTMAAVLVLIGAPVVRRHGAPLDAPANPTSVYDARPEWYFLPLYELLKFCRGRLELVGAIGAPALATILLSLLPLCDRGPSRAPGSRKRYLSVVFLLLAVTAGLGIAAEVADRRSSSFQRQRALADREGRRALALARQGVPVAGGVAVFENDPLARGRRLFGERCAGCHLYQGVGERKAPDLDGWSSRTWLSDFLRDPNGPRFFGLTKVHGMKAVKLSDESLAALVEWIYAQGGLESVDEDLASRGRQVVESSSCEECHGLDGTTEGVDGAPNLAGRASSPWIRAFLEDPGASRFFSEKNDMPKLRGKLLPEDFDSLVELLREERAPATPR